MVLATLISSPQDVGREFQASGIGKRHQLETSVQEPSPYTKQETRVMLASTEMDIG